MSIKISQFLTLDEVSKSKTAQRLGIDNTPPAEAVEHLKIIGEKIFDPLRIYFGCPIAISSGYRSKELNAAIGGSKTSQHCIGQALDIDADVHRKIDNASIFHWMKDMLAFDQLIWEFGNEQQPDWVHVSYVGDSGENRGQVLVSFKKEGKTAYREWHSGKIVEIKTNEKA